MNGQSADRPDYSGVPVTALESLRLRLQQLAHSLSGLYGQLQQATIPAWPALQGQFNIILTQLTSMSASLASFSEQLQRTVAYPLPSFPIAQQGLLTTLLRKKHLPEVQEWIDSGRAVATNVKMKAENEFCSWAADVVQREQALHEWSGFVTRADRDAGVPDTGLQRRVADSEGLSVDQIITFMARGDVPS